MRIIPTKRPLNRIQTELVTSSELLQMSNETERELLVNGVHTYSCAITGKGKMSGKEFADHCRKVWSDKNLANNAYYKLFEKFIICIERTYGQIYVKYQI